MGSAGYFVNGVAVVLIIFFNVMFCFRAYLPLRLHFLALFTRLSCSFHHRLSLTLALYAAYVYPTTVSSMNYNSVILVGVLFLTTAWWFIHGVREYPGPKLTRLYDGGRVVDAIEHGG